MPCPFFAQHSIYLQLKPSSMTSLAFSFSITSNCLFLNSSLLLISVPTNRMSASGLAFLISESHCIKINVLYYKHGHSFTCIPLKTGWWRHRYPCVELLLVCGTRDRQLRLEFTFKRISCLARHMQLDYRTLFSRGDDEGKGCDPCVLWMN